MQKFVAGIAVVMSLTGCGVTHHIGAVSAPMVVESTGAQSEPTLAVAERAVRQALEKRNADQQVLIEALVVMAPAKGTFYRFQAELSETGFTGLKTRYKVDGTYESEHLAVKVAHKTKM
jgi:hypothetical protein